MNILFITDLFPLTDKDYTTSNVLKNFVSEFISKGHNVQVIRPNFLLNSFIRGKKFYKTGFYKDIFNANYLSPFLFNVKSKLCELKPYDIIISHMPSANIFANKLEGYLICGIHNSDLKILTQPIYSVYFKSELLKSFRRAKKLICRSFNIEKQLLAIYPEFKEKTTVVISGIKEELIIKRTPVFNKKIKILSCANLIKRKNIDKLIQACEGMDDVELTIIGDGVELNNLKKIGKNTIFKGRLEQEQVFEEMRNSDIFILPSVDETFGLVYLEAMASGCITIGVKNEGIDGIIKDGENGFLTFPSEEEIKNTILKIKNLNQDDLNKISKNCFNTSKSYTSDICTDLYLDNILINSQG